MIGEDAVMFFGHKAIEGTQARFNMGDGDMKFDRGQSSGNGGVGIAIHQHPIGSLHHHHFLQANEHLTRLAAMRA